MQRDYVQQITARLIRQYSRLTICRYRECMCLSTEENIIFSWISKFTGDLYTNHMLSMNKL